MTVEKILAYQLLSVLYIVGFDYLANISIIE